MPRLVAVAKDERVLVDAEAERAIVFHPPGGESRGEPAVDARVHLPRGDGVAERGEIAIERAAEDRRGLRGDD